MPLAKQELPHPSEAPEFTFVFCGVRVVQSLLFFCREYINNDLFRPIGLHAKQFSNTFIGSQSTVSLDGTYK